jgi:hypothetical protein
MGRNKFKPRGNSAARSPGPGSGGGAVDKVVMARVQAFAAAAAGDVGGGRLDADEVAEALRATYREYQRVKAGPFRALIGRAVELVKKRAVNEAAQRSAEANAQVLTTYFFIFAPIFVSKHSHFKLARFRYVYRRPRALVHLRRMGVVLAIRTRRMKMRRWLRRRRRRWRWRRRGRSGSTRRCCRCTAGPRRRRRRPLPSRH